MNLSNLCEPTTCQDLYYKAMEDVGSVLQYQLLFLAILTVIDFAAMRLYNHGWAEMGVEKHNKKYYYQITSTVLWVRIFVIFTLLGQFFLQM